MTPAVSSQYMDSSLFEIRSTIVVLSAKKFDTFRQSLVLITDLIALYMSCTGFWRESVRVLGFKTYWISGRWLFDGPEAC